MVERVAALRGSPVSCYGSADLVRLDATSRKRWLMQADEVLYLHPGRSRLRGPAINVDEDPLPDVLLEVDHTTDVRRRNLDIYKECGFPEIWVLVPWVSSVRERGLKIHVRREGGYRDTPESTAFPGWKEEKIRLALTEEPLSSQAWRALERVALAMGVREGTGPEDDPLMRSVSRKARTSGHVQGRMEAVAATLRARGIEVSRVFTEDRDLFAERPAETLMAAALACTDEADFRRRIRQEAGKSVLPPHVPNTKAAGRSAKLSVPISSCTGYSRQVIQWELWHAAFWQLRGTLARYSRCVQRFKTSSRALSAKGRCELDVPWMDT